MKLWRVEMPCVAFAVDSIIWRATEMIRVTSLKVRREAPFGKIDSFLVILLKFTEWQRFISVVVITLDFDCMITFQQPRFEPGMDLIFSYKALIIRIRSAQIVRVLVESALRCSPNTPNHLWSARSVITGKCALCPVFETWPVSRRFLQIQ